MAEQSPAGPSQPAEPIYTPVKTPAEVKATITLLRSHVGAVALADTSAVRLRLTYCRLLSKFALDLRSRKTEWTELDVGFPLILNLQSADMSCPTQPATTLSMLGAALKQ